MIEIKFRAWEDGKMLFSPIQSNFGLSRFFGYLREDALLMQFTGLKDKNGKDIYEGDIVIGKWIDCDGGVLLETTVEHKEGCVYPFTSLVGEESGVLYHTEIFSTDFTVIGNIHENKTK